MQMSALGRARPPRPRERPPVPVPAPVGRGEVVRLPLHAVRRVVLRLRGRVLAPEVDGRRRRVPLRPVGMARLRAGGSAQPLAGEWSEFVAASCVAAAG
jgi:hypothetical protein